ncbi:MAG: ribosome silencing factor [Elusimicrobia bacterium GWC2_51_8]|nr:MAG: ribosome silencing factor [Elusimicrobia bacterium GWA2_51_34]OGR60505.1 MAG: ribosome silencing factor [Elusimicrobia bacterium GWC2_51_8]OGR85147.1 MAG: ribosome silencing factor [Elusimicrobia bacterium GWF2_52_66]HAF94514.1 ribosome silencing factor [Elusimicrobiota bacterium]HCE97920.1 ribosome silencing factor [Elusimicrobiota bacterium]
MKNTEFNPLEVPSQRPLALTTAKKIAIEAARLGDSKKAENIVIYELGKNSSLADYAVLMSADSAPQLEAVEEAVNKAFKDRGLFVLYKEGGSSHAWKVLDYGGVLVHIFETGAREFYTMDLLYASCPRIPWREAAARQKIDAKKTVSTAKPKSKPATGKKAKPAAKKKTGAAARKKIKPAKKASRKK